MREGGLEPPTRVSGLDPKSSAFANFATLALEAGPIDLAGCRRPRLPTRSQRFFTGCDPHRAWLQPVRRRPIRTGEGPYGTRDLSTAPNAAEAERRRVLRDHWRVAIPSQQRTAALALRQAACTVERNVSSRTASRKPDINGPFQKGDRAVPT